MGEIKFVLKCFFFACLLMLVSQYKISNETIESKVASFSSQSMTAKYVREVAAGGYKALGEMIENVQRTIKSYKNDYEDHKKLQARQAGQSKVN